MARINEHYLKLKAGYLFPEISRRVNQFLSENPASDLIRLGIGDVTLPLSPKVIEAFHRGVDQMAKADTFKGYGPEQGYDFLKQSILENDYLARGIQLDLSEIFISDGSKCDSANFQEIFSDQAKIAVTDPVYPVYVDTNVMAGRTGTADSSGRYEGLCYLPSTEDNNFSPPLPERPVDLIYLCSPNNPTGTVFSREQLKTWVDFARKNSAIILFDAAYEAYITENHIPHSIYEIEGSREVAVEFRSFSKTAGFTGTRLAFTVVPKEMVAQNLKGEKIQVQKLWNRRHCTKFNGVSFPVQLAGAAIFSEEGKKETRELITYYLNNASIIKRGLEKKGFKVYGGINAPYLWLKLPGKITSWDFFDLLLRKVGIVGTPGSGFGPAGEGYFRLSAFGKREKVEEAMTRIQNFSF